MNSLSAAVWHKAEASKLSEGIRVLSNVFGAGPTTKSLGKFAVPKKKVWYSDEAAELHDSIYRDAIAEVRGRARLAGQAPILAVEIDSRIYSTNRVSSDK